MSKEKESVKLDDLINEVPKPKRRNLLHEFFFKGKTEEEIKAWRAASAQKRKEVWAEKKRRKEETLEKARELVPSMLAYDLLSEETKKENWIPSQEMIDKIKLLIKKDMPLEELRKREFRGVSDRTWHQLMKFVFKSQVANSEDLGAEILRVKYSTTERLKKQIRDIKKQMKLFTEETGKKVMPAYLMQMKRDAEMDLIKLERDVAETLFKVGAVGEKSKAPSFIVNMKLPRPEKKEEKVIEVIDGN